MFCWHRYTKWSDLKEERWGEYNSVLTAKISYTRVYQDKHCVKCNKYKKRFVEQGED